MLMAVRDVRKRPSKNLCPEFGADIPGHAILVRD
jgi:hypothetical protein